MSVHTPSAFFHLHLRAANIGQADPTRQVLISGFPVSYRVIRRDYREADSFELTVDYEKFPFDPRLVRGAIVELYQFDLEREPAFVNDAKTFWMSIPHNELKSLALIAGVVDDISSPLDSDGHRVKIRGRDYTAYFLDSTLKTEIDWTGLRFVDVVRKLMDERIETDQLGLRIVGRDGDVVIEKDADIEALAANAPPALRAMLNLRPETWKARVKEAPKTSTRKKKENETPWAAILETSFEAGLITYVELDQVVVREPVTLNPDRVDPVKTFRWIIGGNLKSYEPSRKLGRQHGIGVLVTSFDPVTGKPLVAKKVDPEPIDDGRAAPLTDSGGKRGARQKARRARPYIVRNIRDQQQLQKIADAIFEQLRHFEMEVDFSTDAMVDASDPPKPVESLRYADPVLFDLNDNWQSIDTLRIPEQLRRMEELGYELGDAKALRALFADLSVPFILSEVVYSFSTEADEGFSLKAKVRSRKHVELASPAELRALDVVVVE